MTIDRKKILVLIIWLTFFTAMFFLARIYLADVYFEKSQDLDNNLSHIKRLKLINKSIKYNKFEPNYYRGRAKLLILSQTYGVEYTSETRFNILQDLKKAENLNSKNLVTLSNLVPLYGFLPKINILKDNIPENIDPNLLEITDNYFTEKKSIYSTNAGFLTMVAKYEKKLGLTDSYIETVGQVRFLRPDLLEWHEAFR